MKLMRLFDRSILAEIGRNTLLLVLALGALLTAVLLVRLLGVVAKGELPTDLFLPYLPWALAEKGAMVLLLSAFAAALLTLQRWMRDSEWVVWRSLGVSRRRLILPLVGIGGLVAILIGLFTLVLSPYAEQQKDQLKQAAQARDETEKVAPGLFRESRDGQRVFFVAREGEAGIGTFFLRQWHNGRQVVIIADRAHVVQRPDGRWIELAHGARYEEGKHPLAFRITAFDTLALWVAPVAVPNALQRAHAMDTMTLLALVQRGERVAAGELLLRLALPIAAVVLLVVALPLAETEPRTHRGVGLLTALLLFFAYTNAISLAQAYVAQGKLSFAAAFALPHLLFLGVALALAGWQYWRRR